MKEDYQKFFKKLTLFSLSDPVPLKEQIQKKQKESGASDQSLFRLGNKFRNIRIVVMYYLTKFDDVIYSSFWVIPKITSANLCKPINDIINYSISIFSLKSGNCGKERKKLQSFEYLEKEKSFFDKIKNNFYNFWRAIIWWKNKKLKKIYIFITNPVSKKIFLITCTILIESISGNVSKFKKNSNMTTNQYFTFPWQLIDIKKTNYSELL